MNTNPAVTYIESLVSIILLALFGGLIWKHRK